MSDEVTVSGKSYISSKRASELTNYSQDYIGQLARSGQISAQRVGGLWYVLLDSLKAHQDGSHLKDVPNVLDRAPASSTDPDSFVGLDGKNYISASRASKLSGYNQDYVGQLARTGQILARQIGNRWYVEEGSVSSHKKEKDALLAAVQSESVGLRKQQADTALQAAPETSKQASLRYFHEDADLLPVLSDSKDSEIGDQYAASAASQHDVEDVYHEIASNRAIHAVPIRKNTPQRTSAHALVLKPQRLPERYQGRGAYTRIPFVPLAASALTIVILVSFGFLGMRSEAVYSLLRSSHSGSSTAAAGSAFESVVAAIERFVTKELVYTRTD